MIWSIGFLFQGLLLRKYGYVYLASIRFEHSVCHGYIHTYIYNIYLCVCVFVCVMYVLYTSKYQIGYIYICIHNTYTMNIKFIVGLY